MFKGRKGEKTIRVGRKEGLTRTAVLRVERRTGWSPKASWLANGFLQIIYFFTVQFLSIFFKHIFQRVHGQTRWSSEHDPLLMHPSQMPLQLTPVYSPFCLFLSIPELSASRTCTLRPTHTLVKIMFFVLTRVWLFFNHTAFLVGLLKRECLFSYVIHLSSGITFFVPKADFKSLFLILWKFPFCHLIKHLGT